MYAISEGADRVPNALAKIIELFSSAQRWFYMGFLGLILANGLNRTTIPEAAKDPAVLILQSIAIGAFIIQFIISNKEVERWLPAVGLIVCAALIGVTSSSYTLLWLCVAVVCARGASLERVALVVAVGYLIILVLAVPLALTGLIENVAIARGTGDSMRYALGFSHPNQLGFTLVAICSAQMCIRYKKETIWDYIIIVFAGLVALFVADSRTAVFGLALLVFFVRVFSRLNSTTARRRAAKIALVILVLCVAGSVVMAVLYDDSNTVMFSISKLLSSRLYYANFYFERYPVTLLGNNFLGADRIVRAGVDTTLLLDNAYCMLLLRHGVLGFLLVLAPLAVILNRLAREGSASPWIAGILLYAILGLSENAFIDISINFYLIGMAQLLPNNNFSEFFGAEQKKEA